MAFLQWPGKIVATINRLPCKVGLILIRIYQRVLSPFLANTCRFYPSCSHYSYQAIYVHGLLQGSILSLKRILRCHPWHTGGYDPVPDSHLNTDD